tara:strand:- start:559 stop:1827 length:1269 start_codon:yes stop_codon:yes gene_type:complete
MRKVKYVNDDYKLVTFDLVADPSTRGAFPSLSESTESGERTRKIVNDTYKKALGEKVFVTMLKESFDNSLQEADKPYENDESSYDEIMKMRGYPDVDEIMKRGDVQEDPFYKAMMAAVKGATPVKAKKSKKNGKVRRQDDNTKPTHSRVAKFLAEVKKKVDDSLDEARGRGAQKFGSTSRSRRAAQKAYGAQQRQLGAKNKALASVFEPNKIAHDNIKARNAKSTALTSMFDANKATQGKMRQDKTRNTALTSMFDANKKTRDKMRQDSGEERYRGGGSSETPGTPNPQKVASRRSKGGPLHQLFQRGAAWGGMRAGKFSKGVRDFKNTYNRTAQRSGASLGSRVLFKNTKVARPGVGTYDQRHFEVPTTQGQQDKQDQDMAAAQRKKAVDNVLKGEQIAAHTQPTYSKMAEFLGEAYIYNK